MTFANQLSIAIESIETTEGKKAYFASACKMSPSMLSHYLAGKSPSSETAGRMVAVAPESHRPQLLRAYLQNELSKFTPELQQLVSVASASTEPNQLPSNLDDELRAMIVHLAGRASRSPEVRDFIVSTGKLLS